MIRKLTTAAKYILSFLLAAVLLYFSFRGVDWAAFAESLKSCRWSYVILSMLAGATAFAMRGFRWKQILEPIDKGTKTITAINGVMISNVANMVIPYCGELARCGVITKRSTRFKDREGVERPLATYDKVLGTAVLERIWDILSVIILLAVLLVFQSGRFSGFLQEKVFTPIASRFQGSLWILIIAVLLAMAAAISYIIKKRHSSRLCGRIFGVIRRFTEGFASCLHIKKAWLFFLYTAIIWAMYWLQMVFIIHALPEISGMGLIDALFIMLVGSFATCLPVPGGFGAYHYIVSLALFSLYGYPQAGLGIVFATMSHESQALTMIITGFASYVYESLKK